MPNNGEYDEHWVVYDSDAWRELVEQGYITVQTERRHGQTWALMRKDVRHLRRFL